MKNSHRWLLVGLASLFGLSQASTGHSLSAVSDAVAPVWVSYRPLVFMKSALQDAQKFAQVSQQYPCASDLKNFLMNNVTEKPLDSAAVLVLYLSGDVHAEYKRLDDLGSTSQRLTNWDAETVRAVATLCSAFVSRQILFANDLLRVANAQSSVVNGWSTIQAAGHDPLVGIDYATTLSDAYSHTLKVKQSEYSGLLQAHDPAALEIQKFYAGAPPELRDGDLKWKGAVPDVSKRATDSLRAAIAE